MSKKRIPNGIHFSRGGRAVFTWARIGRRPRQSPQDSARNVNNGGAKAKQLRRWFDLTAYF